MSATQIPRATTDREQLVKVIDAAEALTAVTSDPRVPTEVRDHALRAKWSAWGALQTFDAAPRHHVLGVEA